MAERRDVLKVLAGAAGATAVGAAVVPVAGLAVAPLSTGAADTGGWTPVGRLSALTEGVPRKVNVVGAESDAWTVAGDRRLGSVFLMRGPDNRITALSNICPHLGCGVDVVGDHLSCPCHDSDFTMAGRRLNGPSPRDLDPIEVRVEAGVVSVRFQRYQPGLPGRVPMT